MPIPQNTKEPGACRKWLPIMCAVYAVLAVAAATAPRFAAQGKEGLAAAATAALCFLVLAAIASVISLVALIMTLRAWKTLSAGMRVVGLSPAILSVAGGLMLIGVLMKSREEARIFEAPSKVDTAHGSRISS